MCEVGECFMENNMSRSKSRVIAMRILYQIALFEKHKISYDVEEVISSNVSSDQDFIKDLVYGVLNHFNDIDEVANKYLNNWKINRLGFTDQAIIRIGIYELLYTTTPYKVCIDEAIEMAHDYSDDKVVKMVNAVLDSVYHSRDN